MLVKVPRFGVAVAVGMAGVAGAAGGSGRAMGGEKPRRPNSGAGARRTGSGGGGVEIVLVSAVVAAYVFEVVSFRPAPVLKSRGTNLAFATGTPISLGTTPTTTMT